MLLYFATHQYALTLNGYLKLCTHRQIRLYIATVSHINVYKFWLAFELE